MMAGHCPCCGVRLDLLPYVVLGVEDAQMFGGGRLCLCCALEVLPGGSIGRYGYDFRRHDVRCHACGGVGEWVCAAARVSWGDSVRLTLPDGTTEALRGDLRRFVVRLCESVHVNDYEVLEALVSARLVEVAYSDGSDVDLLGCVRGDRRFYLAWLSRLRSGRGAR